MRKTRWVVDGRRFASGSAKYHCMSRVVNRQFVFGDEEREAFRMFMRMYENFSGCRILSYCVMSNHFHLLLEVPTSPVRGLSDHDLLGRLRALYDDAYVAEVASELDQARKEETEISGIELASGNEDVEAVGHSRVAQIHKRYTYRMNDLSEFMKGLLIRFTRWFNRKHSRKGTLWEERFKSVIVESGLATRTMSAYIDLNPVRAGIVDDPARYRWSSYGEAVGGGRRGNGKKARTGLIRAIQDAHSEEEIDPAQWKEVSRRYRRLLGMALQRKSSETVQTKVVRSGEQQKALKDLEFSDMLRHRIRYFSDGAVLGSKNFVNERFLEAKHRFSAKRKDGARKMRGRGRAAEGMLWVARDLRVDI